MASEPDTEDTTSEASVSRPNVVYHAYMTEAEYSSELNGQDGNATVGNEEEAQVIISRLRQLYDEGMPFFSKTVFRDTANQLDHCRANPRPFGGPDPHIISIPDLHGTVIKFALETGRVRSRYQDTTESTEFIV